jgi:hypothetical protein
MKYKKLYIVVCALIFSSCGKNEDISSSSGGSFLTADLLDKPVLEEVLTRAISFEDLNWVADNTPATLNDLPYTGWIKHQSDETWGVAHLQNGIEHGPFLFMHQNGKPKLSGAYLSGSKSGKWKTWEYSGLVIAEEVWANGKLVKQD